MENKTSTKARKIIVILFIILFAIVTFINLRGTYLQYKELGTNYVEAYKTNLQYRFGIFAVNFVILYFIMYFTNRGIKKGLKPFFEKEKKEMPKLPNKSISFIISTIVSAIMSNVLMEKLLLCAGNTSFGISDPAFGLDVAFFMFQKPFIITILAYILILIVALTAYMALYYILVLNKHFDGVDGKMMRESLLVKKMIRNAMFVVVIVAIMNVLNVTDVSLSKMLTIKNSEDSSENIEIIGASYTDVMIQRWGYLIFSVIIIIFAARAIKAFKQDSTPRVLKNLAVIPGYLVVMFAVIIGFNLIFVNSNKLDKEKEYIEDNIKFTKAAYNIDINESNLENSGTITQAEVDKNQEAIQNTKIVSQDVVLKTLEDNQTGTGYYTFRNANIAKYKINGNDKLVYVSPREITNSGRTYNSKTYEYTHGKGQIVIDATSVNQNGNVNYIQKDVAGKDEALGATSSDIYFGLETNNAIATNAKNKQEYDYTDENGVEHTSTYNGTAGLNLGFGDRLVLGIKTGNWNLAFSSDINKDSKILINRNIIKRAKEVLPYIVYDENPYTVVTSEGKTVWVLDGYTISSKYPYSQFTPIEHDGIKEKVNYIRNSVKVIIDSYDGTMKFYITDKSDPIIMAYRNIYPTVFESLDAEIPEDISEHFVYPEYLYDVQSKLLQVYHNVKADVLYRSDDVWNFAKYNTANVTKATGTQLKPYYTMVNKNGKNEIGLIQIYTPEAKQNIISYLVGTTDGNTNKLTLYKFSQDSNIFGPMQLDNQIEQDEAIHSEIQTLNTSGTKVTKDMVIVPVDNTLLYVESVYQTMLNEESKIPMLKKIVVASGNKVAIGDNLEEALNNLLSKEASNIEVENTEDIDGLIDAIVKANKNLTESTKNKDWELMGSDINKLQELIDSLEDEKAKEDKKKAETKNEIVNNEETNEVTNEVSNNFRGNLNNEEKGTNIIKEKK